MTAEAGTDCACDSNRLVDELRNAASSARVTFLLGAVGSPMVVVMAVMADGSEKSALTRMAAGLVSVGFLGLIKQRRYLARAAWMRSTPRWWERLEEAPTLITFPRLTRAVRALMPARYRPDRYHLR